MKIGVIGSWYDMLALWKLLNVFDHEYTFFVDYAHRPWSERTVDDVVSWIHTTIDAWKKQGIQHFIVPPVYEHFFTQDWALESSCSVLPVYKLFVLKSLQSSRVGKVWLVTTTDTLYAQGVFAGYSKSYSLTVAQQATRRFHVPFAVWAKKIRMLTFFPLRYAKSDRMVRKSIKHDLRYFRDADVDVIIPMDWSMLYYEKIITHTLNHRRYRVCGSSLVASVLQELLSTNQAQYACTISSSQKNPPFVDEKKWMLLLSRWWSVEVAVL